MSGDSAGARLALLSRWTILALCAIGASAAAVLVGGLFPPESSAATLALPSAMAALGDSLTQAYGAGGASGNYPAESWSAGADSGVNSHYSRLLVDDPALSGRNYNDAVSGTSMSATYAQAGFAIGQGAGYVTVWSGTNDVCTQTVAQMTSVASYTSQLTSTLTLLGSIADTRVLVVSIPDWLSFWNKFHSNSGAQAAWAAYPNRCPDLLSSSASSKNRQSVGQRIVALNSALKSVCAQFSFCRYDGGAIYALWATLTSSDLAFDYFHLSPAGEAKVADAAWKAGFFAVPTNLSLPVVTGPAVRGQTLSASFGVWAGSPVSFGYQWRRCDGAGASCADIGGATTQSYVLQAADVGKTLRVVVTATNAAGSTPATSAQTAVVVATATVPVNTSLPSVSGSAIQGQSLVAGNGGWSNSPTGFGYQWRRCDGAGAGCVDIGGAVGQAYVLQGADVGGTLRVVVTATNAAGSASATSAQTAVVVAAVGGSTFGRTSVGALTTSGGTNYLDSSGPYGFAGGGSVSKLSAYLAGGSSSTSLRGVIYANSGGSPGALVGVTSQVTIAAGQAAGWVDLPFASPVGLGAGSYWLGYWIGGANIIFFYDAVAGSEAYAPDGYSAAGTPNNPYGPAGSIERRLLAVCDFHRVRRVGACEYVVAVGLGVGDPGAVVGGWERGLEQQPDWVWVSVAAL